MPKGYFKLTQVLTASTHRKSH